MCYFSAHLHKERFGSLPDAGSGTVWQEFVVHDYGAAKGLSDAELSVIEQRAWRALEVAPLPWTPWRETREGIGGCSFVQFGSDGNEDNEMYLDVHLAHHRLVSPDPRLDAIIDVIGYAPDDILRLVAEIRRLRELLG